MTSEQLRLGEGRDIVPLTDFLKAKNKLFLEVVLSRLRPKMRKVLEPLLQQVPCGIFAIKGFSGSGKTDTVATLVNVCLANEQLDKIMAYAPTHGAASNLCSRLARVNRLAVGQYNARPGVQGRRFALIIRGHNPLVEFSHVLDAVRHRYSNSGRSIAVPSPAVVLPKWEEPLSVCEWTLKVVGFDDYDLDPLDHARLWEIRKDFQTSRRVEPLRRFFRGEVFWEEIDLDTGDDAKPSKILSSIMENIVMGADVLGTTPYGCREGIYWNFCRDVAKTSVLDEAGAMTVPDALLGWPTFRPWILAGDTRQLSPLVMTLNEKRNNRYVNMFGRYLRISILEKVGRMGWPVFVMNEQLRMVRGGFDTARACYYPDIPDFSYSELCDVTHHPLAVVGEKWITSLYPALECKLDRGLVQPALIQCVGCCVTEESGSRYNKEQAQLTIRLVVGLVAALGGTDSAAGKISIISPYKAMNKLLCKLLDAEPVLAGFEVPVNTTDTFQGRETPFVFYVLTIDSKSGPGHVASPHRSNVGITRHTDGLFVIGDSRTSSIRPGKKGRRVEVINDDGGVELVDPRGLDDLFGWFKTEKRCSFVS